MQLFRHLSVMIAVGILIGCIAAPVSAQNETYEQARAYYDAGSAAWMQAWNASDFDTIRLYLNQSRAEFANCLNASLAVNDTANQVNLTYLVNVSTAYISLADAALAMYNGADVYTVARTEMTAANYMQAGLTFDQAALMFTNSQSLFNQSTVQLQDVEFNGTEFGNGTEYIATIVPILNTKAAYMGEFANYSHAWHYTAAAYDARLAGNETGFRTEATLALNLFGPLRSSPSFGADATANYNVLAAALAGGTPAPTPTPVPTDVTPTATTTPLPTPGTAAVGLSAQNLAFNTSTITVPAGSQVVVTFENLDQGVQHNFALYTDSSASTTIFRGTVVTGPTTTTYSFTAPETPGTYFFRCDVHPTTMTGTFVVT